MGILVGAWKTITLRVMWTVETQLSWFERGLLLSLARDLSCDILSKSVAAFCPCPKSLPQAKLESFELILLVEEISI